MPFFWYGLLFSHEVDFLDRQIKKRVDIKDISIIISNACSEANHSEEMISRIRHRLKRLLLIRLFLRLKGGIYNGFSEWKDQNNLL